MIHVNRTDDVSIRGNKGFQSNCLSWYHVNAVSNQSSVRKMKKKLLLNVLSRKNEAEGPILKRLDLNKEKNKLIMFNITTRTNLYI